MRLAPAVGAQGVTPVTVGQFVGRDSLDASKEPGTASHVRSSLRGAASWSLQRDSIDLRDKRTLRIELPAPSPATLVLRFLDTLPPAPGDYEITSLGTGESQRNRHQVLVDVVAPDGGHRGQYLPLVGELRIESGGSPTGELRGTLRVVAVRSAELPERPMVPPIVTLVVRGAFAARPDTRRPEPPVSPAMQERVLDRALMGFAITSMGAENGDGSADSTHDVARGRRFLLSRWGHALTIEHIEASPHAFLLRVRGRFVPVVCEFDLHREYPECETMPEPVVAAASVRATISGRLVLPLAAHRASNGAVVSLLPAPVPLRDAFDSLCAVQDSALEKITAPLEARLKAAKTKEEYAVVEAEAERIINKDVGTGRGPWLELIASYATRRAAAGPDGQFSISDVPAGNYILFAGVVADERVEWFLPVSVRTVGTITRDLDLAAMSHRDWGCGTPLPFPAVRRRR
ncbi:MAG: hypothetical protein JF589_07630 [Gemmatimonadetes bacterium]|nr:hypothetical protein [Gemmatimonadota bacterium]